MATPFTHEQAYDRDPATVMAMLQDVDFIRAKCERTGSLETTATVTPTDDGGCTIVSTRVLPAEVPAAAKAFVGETLTITETQVWTAPGPDGSRSAQVSVDFGAPMAFSSTMTLEPSGTGTRVHTQGSFKASVPFVGGKIESSAAEQTARYLDKEQLVGNEWLAARG